MQGRKNCIDAGGEDQRSTVRLAPSGLHRYNILYIWKAKPWKQHNRLAYEHSESLNSNFTPIVNALQTTGT